MRSNKEFDTKEMLHAIIGQLIDNFQKIANICDELEDNHEKRRDLYLTLITISMSLEPAFDYIEHMEGLSGVEPLIETMRHILEQSIKEGMIGHREDYDEKR